MKCWLWSKLHGAGTDHYLCYSLKMLLCKFIRVGILRHDSSSRTGIMILLTIRSTQACSMYHWHLIVTERVDRQATEPGIVMGHNVRSNLPLLAAISSHLMLTTRL